jgi:hypothetical protein
MLVGVHDPPKGQLLEIAQARRPPALLLDAIHGRHKYRHQDCDYRDYYQKLDKSEPFP